MNIFETRVNYDFEPKGNVFKKNAKFSRLVVSQRAKSGERTSYVISMPTEAALLR
jgi:hypothetical protein